jgi:predicted ATP-grasp superfamily ATP-dependent carboligase
MKSGRTTPPSKEITFKTLPLCPYHKIASDKRKLMQEVGNKLKTLKNYEFFQETKKLGIKRLRVLLCGAPGAGSSINQLISQLVNSQTQQLVK